MKQFYLALVGAFYLMSASSATASADLRFDQPGSWVESADINRVLDDNPGSEAILVILDIQRQLEHGKVSSYHDVAVRIDSTKTMANMLSLLSPSWHPDQGDLTVHRYQIIRGDDVIDLTKVDNIFDVIRREKNLERQQINGMLTAISQVEDLQLDDIVRMSYTVTSANDALAGRVQAAGGFASEDVKVDFVRQRIRWPVEMDVKWRGSKAEIVPVITNEAGWTNLEVDYRSKAPDVEIPKDAPMRFKDRNLFEVASFASWKDVSRVNAALYPRKDGIVKGGALDQEIQAIAAQTRDKKQRTALALRLVQDKIRYLYNGMGFGNYTPQQPEETWKLRYGDCKAKTYLLLAILRRLDIKAVPMLVSASQRDIVKERLPSFQAFDHIIVKAEIDGTDYWLDGTGSGTRIDDMVNSPTHRYGLPSVRNGAELEEIPIRRPGRPFQTVIVTYDVTAGTDLPAAFELQATLRDSDATALKNAMAQFSEEKVKELREETALGYVLDGLVYETSFTFDEEEETGYLTAKGLSYLDWDIKTGRHRHELWSVSDNFKVQKTRDEEELRGLPVNMSYPIYFQYRTNYILPERYNGASLEGLAESSSEIAGFQFSRSAYKDGNQIVSEEEYHTGRWELPAEAFETERRKLARLNRDGVKIILPEDRVLPWREVEDFKRSGQVEGHRAAFDQHVANAREDDDDALINRAYFHQILGEYDNAIADVESALAINSDAENYKWLGDLKLGSDPAAAIAAYSSAIEIKPAYFDALLDLIRLHVRLGDYDEAHAVLERAKDAGLTETSFDSIHIEILQAEGKFDEAMAIINDLVDEEPDNAGYLADRCLLRAMEKTALDLALADCTNMIELAERSSYYHFIRALVYYQRGEYQLAIDDLDKSIKVSDRRGYVYHLRSRAHRKLGQIDAAENDEKTARFRYKYAGWYWGHFSEDAAAKQ
ncbi:DUF3857 domain-containing protein [uncultured Parasphingorhabdus sp.]|uniref:DUF3857 domain-containing protein n=1 Tax=uncultured Parasphingorhabdus sp. TaxID=2709694 RepID=UPI002AA7B6E5|nr:DUF3857 domain-containing protein [uncultured Parasphingorhabdus sp.]